VPTALDSGRNSTNNSALDLPTTKTIRLYRWVHQVPSAALGGYLQERSRAVDRLPVAIGDSRRKIPAGHRVSKCWNTCTLHNKIVGHLSALNNCIWLYFMFAVATISESYLYLHDLCVFVCVLCIFYVYMGQVPEIKLMMMMSSDSSLMFRRSLTTVDRISSHDTRERF